MNTVASEVEPQGLTLPEYLTIGRRRLRTMLVTAASGLLISILLAVFLPPVYESKATILIEQQEMPTELVRSTVTSYADERVQVISQRVMTTQTLLDIIRRYDLYRRQRERESREALIKRMRKDIDVKMISADVIDPRSGRPTEANIAFSVAYYSHSAEQAAKVANELTTLFLNENLETRTRLAQDAASFLEGEADRVNHHMMELEAQISAFRAKHFQSLPELEGLNEQLLDRSSQDIDKDETHRSALEQQETYLEAQLAQLKPNSALYSDSGERILSTNDRLKMARSQLADAQALYGPNHPDVERLSREVAGLEGQSHDTADINDLRRSLQDAQTQLAAAQQRYGPEYPDRIRLEKLVPALQKDLDAATAAQAAKASANAAGTDTGVMKPKDADNPAYIQIEAQLSETRNELDALAAEETRLRAERDGYVHKLALEPETEKEYRELNVDYDNTKLKYQELRAKQQEATVSKNLEADRKGERFTLIEPPLVPEEPESPNRPLVLALGLVLSLGLGVGAGAVNESLDGSVRDRRDLVALLAGPAPLAIIPHIELAAVRPSPWRRRLLLALAVLIALGVALTAINFFYRPLDVLWFELLRRFGP
jgi:polysaccharide biosynthesis transport protein